MIKNTSHKLVQDLSAGAVQDLNAKATQDLAQDLCANRTQDLAQAPRTNPALKALARNRFLILRTLTQGLILACYFAANAYGVSLLSGTLSFSVLLERIPLADPFAVLQMLAAGAVLGAEVLLGALIIFSFYFIIGGRAFCSWVCPLNSVTSLANFTARYLGLKSYLLSNAVSKNTRYYFLALSFVLSFLSGFAVFEFVSPIGITVRAVVFGLGAALGVTFLVFVFDLLFLKHGWCGRLCPLGAFYSAVNFASLLKVKYDLQKCTLCMKCKEVCPEKLSLAPIGKQSGFLTHFECTNCGRCIDVCDDRALKFSIRNFKRNTNEK